jgi:hypothetical protein
MTSTRDFFQVEKIGTNQVGVLWTRIGQQWQGDKATLAALADDTVLIGGVEIGDVFFRAIEDRDAALMLVVCDRADEAGANPELTRQTREAVRHFYPATA